MTTIQTPTPSSVTASTMMNPTSSTPISRMLYLRSNQANQSYGPSDKAWVISPMYTRGKYHNLIVRSLQILHLFPNIKSPVTLNTGSKQVTIPAGNFDPSTIARYLNEQLYPDVETVCYDAKSLCFRFFPSIDILNEGTTAQNILGFIPGQDYIGVTESVLPVQLRGPNRIVVNTNLQLYNIPISGRLAVLPILGSYGEMLHYDNWGSTHSHLCMDQHFQTLRISLVDENDDPLNGVDEIPWDILISFEPIDNPGFQNFIAP